jgi:hypothetical protein
MSSLPATPATFLIGDSPLLFVFSSVYLGAEVALPLYYFIYYTIMPIARFRASDLRLTDLSYSRSTLPVVLILWHFPMLVCSFTSKGERLALFLKMLPFAVSAAQFLLRRTGIIPSTIQLDRLTNVTRDMPTLHRTAKTLAVISFATWFNTALSCFGGSSSGSVASFSFEIHSFSSTELLLYASSLLWIVYLFSDLKRAGMVRQNWFVLLVWMGLSSVVLGPAATVAGAWTWRETLLATKRHWGAIVALKENEVARQFVNGDKVAGNVKT